MARKLTHEEASAVMLAAGLTPLEPYENSKKPWKCECQTCKAIVTPAFSSVQTGQGGCKFCALAKQAARQKMDDGEASKVMFEHGFEPLEPYPGNQKLWHCKCSTCGNEIKIRRLTVTQNGTGCKYCWQERRGKALRFSPDAAKKIMESAGLTPIEPYETSDKPWRCVHNVCGRIVTPRFNSVHQGGGGCRPCGLTKWNTARRKSNSEASEIMRSAGFEPLEEYPGSKSHWRCLHLECGAEVSPTYADVRMGDGGCFKCGAKKRGQASRLNSDEARQFMISKGLEPIEPYELSNKPWACIHIECGSLVHPTFASIQGGQRGCRPCAIKEGAVRSSYTPEFAVKQANLRGYEPLENYPGAMAHWSCTHIQCGRVVKATLNTLMSGKGCCMDCGAANRADKSRFTAEEATAIVQKFGLEPLVAYPGFHEPWLCKHLECGREVNPKFSYVRSRESGCKFCSTKGLDYTAEGTIYLLERQDYFSAKVGITTPNSKTDRIAAHVKEGWQLVSTWKTSTAGEAEVIEDRALEWWRDVLDAPISMRKEDMKSGWTETASLLYVSIEDTAKFIDRLISELDNS
jgi:hypothetical protein